MPFKWYNDAHNANEFDLGSAPANFYNLFNQYANESQMYRINNIFYSFRAHLTSLHDIENETPSITPWFFKKLLSIVNKDNEDPDSCEKIQYTSNTYSLSNAEASDEGTISNLMKTSPLASRFSTTNAVNTITVFWCKRNYTAAQATLERIISQNNWETNTLLNNLAQTVKQDKNHYVRICIDETHRKCCVYTNRQFDAAAIHKIWAITPFAFDAFKDNAEAKQFAELLYNDDIDGIMQVCATDIDIWNKSRSERLLKNFEEVLKRGNQGAIKNLQDKIENYKSHITVLNNDLETYESMLKDTMYTLTGMMTVPVTVNPETMEFLRKSKNITFNKCTKVNADDIIVTIQTPVFNYIKKDVEMYYKHPENPNAINQYENIAWIFKKAFIDREYTLICTTKIRVPLNRNSSWTVYGPDDTSTFPNPHMWHYNCFDSTKTNVRHAIESNDYIMAFNQLIAAVGQITFTDGIVIRRMVDDFFYDFHNCKCWQDHDGMLHSLDELWEAECKKNTEAAE